MFEREIRDLAFVPRWGIVRCIRRQSVAEHSFYVAIYADQIAELLDWGNAEARLDLLRHAISHDWDEILTSDIAAPAKRVLKRVAGEDAWAKFSGWCSSLMAQRAPDYLRWQRATPLATELEAILKVADLLEAVMYLAEEQNLGNGNLHDRATLLSEQMFEAIKKLPFKNDTQRLPLVTHITEAIKSQRHGFSKVVRSDDGTGGK